MGTRKKSNPDGGEVPSSGSQNKRVNYLLKYATNHVRLFKDCRVCLVVQSHFQPHMWLCEFMYGFGNNAEQQKLLRLIVGHVSEVEGRQLHHRLGEAVAAPAVPPEVVPHLRTLLLHGVSTGYFAEHSVKAFDREVIQGLPPQGTGELSSLAALPGVSYASGSWAAGRIQLLNVLPAHWWPPCLLCKQHCCNSILARTGLGARKQAATTYLGGVRLGEKGKTKSTARPGRIRLQSAHVWFFGCILCG